MKILKDEASEGDVRSWRLWFRLSSSEGMSLSDSEL